MAVITSFTMVGVTSGIVVEIVKTAIYYILHIGKIMAADKLAN